MATTVRSIKYYGGKGSLYKWVIDNLPDANLYVEAFGGGAWVLLNKPRHPMEVYNDIDDGIVTMFRVIQDVRLYNQLRRKLRYTLYARSEYTRAVDILRNPAEHTPIDRAWAKFVYHEQGMSGHPFMAAYGSWSRHISKRKDDFRDRVSRIYAIHKRLQGVQIDNRDALEVIQYWDSPQTVFYLDPPYVPSTRKDRNIYVREMTTEQHEQLIDLLLQVKGKFALSSYANPIYDRLVDAGVAYRIDREHRAICIAMTRQYTQMRDGDMIDNEQRVESLYIKGNKQRTLF